ncbi:hypothetical protein D3C86_246790 [compost metagenome]
MLVGLTELTVPDIPSNVTTAGDTKFVPLITTNVPPATLPDTGEMEVMEGRRLTVMPLPIKSAITTAASAPAAQSSAAAKL